MKNLKLILLILAILQSFQSCNNDNVDEQQNQTIDQRIKQINYYDEFEEVSNKGIYTYDGENIINITESRLRSNGEWQDYYIADYEYNGNIISCNTNLYSSQYDTWSIKYKTDYTVNNGLITEIFSRKFENNVWRDYYKYTYQYDDDNLISWKFYSDEEENGNLSLNIQGQNIFDNNNLIEHFEQRKDETDTWISYFKDTFSYVDGKNTGWIHYLPDTDNWTVAGKKEYIFVGNQITNATIYSWNETNWSEYLHLNYSYNSNGDLIESYINDILRASIEYEEGIGNSVFLEIKPHISIYRPMRF